MQHSFDISIAQKFGVNVALFLNNIAFWIHKNLANEKHFYDGRYWTYNSQEAFTKLFPYWTRQNLRTVIKDCIDQKLILTGNYNETKYDRTSWYALTDLGLSLFPSLFPLVETLGWNQPIKKLEPTTSLVGINQPIPDSKTDFKTDKKSFYKNSNEKKHEFAKKMDNIPNEIKSTVKEIDEYHPHYDIQANDWEDRLKKKRTLIKEMNLNFEPDQVSLAYLNKIKSNPKLSQEKSHGSDKIKQRGNITTSKSRGNSVRKIESYLPH